VVDVELKAIPNVSSFLAYIRKLVQLRRADPRNDLFSALIDAEEAGQQLNEDELLAMVFLLLIAGHETTVNLIGDGALALLRNPEQMEMLRGNPALIKSAVEELLRYDSPLETATERYAREDMAICASRKFGSGWYSGSCPFSVNSARPPCYRQRLPP
jgi:cytochrome P450 PksS